MPSDRLRSPRRITLIGNPASRRIAAFCDAARQVGGFQVEVVSYLDLLAGRADLPKDSTGKDVVRIESPGECVDATRAILKAGIAPLAERGDAKIALLSAEEIERRPFDRGEIVSPRQWFHGYRRILMDWEARGREREIRWASQPSEIVTAFDKLACLEKWTAAGISTPRRYAGVSTYDEIRRRTSERHKRLFVKLRYGYSAMGAVALEWRGSLVRAITTVETVQEDGRSRLFVTKRPRVLLNEYEIAWLVDSLGREEIVVEDWLPKARWEGKPFDLRIVTINQRVQHVVGRANASPFTNLNLDAKRVSREDVVQRLGDAWSEVESLAERAASHLPRASVLGLDVLVKPCLRRFALLEANAFGDYLPGLLHNRRSTYEAYLHSLTNENGIVKGEALV